MNRPSGCEFHTRCPYVGDLCAHEASSVTQDDHGRAFTCHYPLGEREAAE
jgi:ABC-type antimicrobial peptide transport system ATPase subunit